MITAGDFRNGVTFDMDGSVFQIIEFQNVKPGIADPKNRRITSDLRRADQYSF